MNNPVQFVRIYLQIINDLRSEKNVSKSVRFLDGAEPILQSANDESYTDTTTGANTESYKSKWN